MQYIAFLGIALTAIGAYIAARGVKVSPHEAATVGVARIAHDDLGENMQQPLPQSLWKSSVAAQRGFYFILAGSVLQAVPALWSIVADLL